jgi:hypothetical protein
MYKGFPSVGRRRAAVSPPDGTESGVKKVRIGRDCFPVADGPLGGSVGLLKHIGESDTWSRNKIHGAGIRSALKYGQNIEMHCESLMFIWSLYLEQT